MSPATSSSVNSIQPVTDNPSINPHNIIISLPPSSFLRSTVNHHFVSLNEFPPSSSSLRCSSVVAVSEVVKQKFSKSDASTSNLLITKEEGLEVYEDMVLGRSFEDMHSDVHVLQRQIEIEKERGPNLIEKRGERDLCPGTHLIVIRVLKTRNRLLLCWTWTLSRIFDTHNCLVCQLILDQDWL